MDSSSVSNFSAVGFKSTVEDGKLVGGLLISGKPLVDLPLLPRSIKLTLCLDRSGSMGQRYTRERPEPVTHDDEDVKVEDVKVDDVAVDVVPNKSGGLLRGVSAVPAPLIRHSDPTFSAPVLLPLKRADCGGGGGSGGGVGVCRGLGMYGVGAGGYCPTTIGSGPSKYDTMLKSVTQLCKYITLVNENERTHGTSIRIELKILGYDDRIECVTGTVVDEAVSHVILYPENIDSRFNDRLVTGLAPRGSTDIHKVLVKAFEGVPDTPTDSTDMVMLITDGLHNVGRYSSDTVIEQFANPDRPFRNKKQHVVALAFGGAGDFDMGFLAGVSKKVLTAYDSREAYDAMLGVVFDASTTLTKVSFTFPSAMTILNDGVDVQPVTRVSCLDLPQFYLSQMMPMAFTLDRDTDRLVIRVRYTDTKGVECDEVVQCNLVAEEYTGSINKGINMYVESLKVFSAMVGSTKTQEELRDQAVGLHALMKSFVPRDPTDSVWIKFSELFNAYTTQLKNFIDSTYTDRSNYNNMMQIAQSQAAAYSSGGVACLSRAVSESSSQAYVTRTQTAPTTLPIVPEDPTTKTSEKPDEA